MEESALDDKRSLVRKAEMSKGLDRHIDELGCERLWCLSYLKLSFDVPLVTILILLA